MKRFKIDMGIKLRLKLFNMENHITKHHKLQKLLNRITN